MSAVLLDEFVGAAAPQLRLVGGSVEQVGNPHLAGGVLLAPVPSPRMVSKVGVSREWGAPTRIQASTSPGGWKLTRRGIAVVMVGFVGMALAGLITVVAAFLGVSDAPLSATEVAALSATS